MLLRNIWCVRVRSVWRGMLEETSIPLRTERTYTHTHTHTHTHIYTHIHTHTHTYIHTRTHIYTHTHTKCYAAASPHRLFTFLTNFKISNFNKKHTSSLKMISMMIETCWSVLKCFNKNILD